MICKKVSKVKNKKSSSLKGQKSKSLSKSRRQSASQSSPSGAKHTKSRAKQTKNSINKKSNDKNNKKSDKTKPNNKSEDKTKKSKPLAKKDINIKTNKGSKIKKIKEIGKKVKCKTSDKINLVKEVIKRNLRNNTKILFESDVTNEKKVRNPKESSDCIITNKNLRQNSDTKSLNTKNNEKHSLRSVSQNSSKFNLCSKLFPTLDSNKSVIDNKKPVKPDSKTKTSRNNSEFGLKKAETRKIVRSVSKSKKMKEKKKTHKAKCEDRTDKKVDKKSAKKSRSSDERYDKKRTDKSTKSEATRTSATKSAKDKKNESKSKSKTLPKHKDNRQKNGLTAGRSHRLASLNASAKVRLLCENETEKNEKSDKYEDRQKDKTIEKNDKKSNNKTSNKSKTKKKVNSCRALVPVDSSQRAVAVRKRKLVDDSIEIIDTRSCKRMASLNASAIMAASYSPERVKRSKSVESNHSNNSVEMVREMQTFSQTVSRYEITPPVNAINGIHVNQVSHQNSVILSAHKHETIETVKQLKVSNKIKDRLLGIARLERQERAKQKRLQKKNNCLGVGVGAGIGQPIISSPEVSGFQATKVQVTKVTHINTSQGVNKDKAKKKSGHQIDAILETDSSIVHKYQVQTKATIQMQTTFNSTNGSAIANVTTLTSPQTTAITGSTPRMQIHLTDTPIPVPVPVPMPTPGPAQPTYFNMGTPTPAVVQVHSGYQPSALNPMPIINLSEPYPPHYSSAFSVPQFAAHSHPSTPLPFTQALQYFNPGLYQPAGPLLHGFQDPCLIHKPIPFHPPPPQVNHIHSSPQFPNASQSGQTFANDLSPAFAASHQFYSQMQTPIRAPQTVFFQAVPQTNGTAFTLLNPGVHYSHPTLISGDQFVTNRENPVLANDTTFLNMNKIVNESNSDMNTNTNPTVTPTPNAVTQRNVSKSSQCSPQNRDQSNQRPETYSCDSSNSGSVRVVANKANVIPVETQHKRTNKSFNKSLKKKKSLLLNPSCDRRGDELIRNNRNTSSQTLTPKHNASESRDKVKNTTTISSSQTTKTNSVIKNNNNRNAKTVSLQVSPSLPSVPVPSPQMGRHLPLKKSKKRFSHGWSWEGSPQHKYVYLNNEEQSYLRKCYAAIRHNEGDLIRVRDCVLLRSGPRKTDLPFVAKIAALWESPEGEMMMSLLWYYRPEHTDLEYYSAEMSGELFASKHRDTNSVACIDDKCYVLTYNEFCRYRRSKLWKQSRPSGAIVPTADEPYPRAQRIPPARVLPELVFCCRKVYDYRQKRILKNPI